MTPIRGVGSSNTSIRPNDASNLGNLNATVTGGVLRAPRIVVPLGLTLNLTSSLILVADDLLQVDGPITLAANLPQGRSVDVTLASLNGGVVIGATGQVGSFRAAAATAPPDVSVNPLFARAAADGGANGGAIAILAPKGTIDVQGTVYGFSGGDGGAAAATSTWWPACG